MTSILASAILALAVAAPAPPASAPTPREKPIFTPFKGWETHTINVDTESFHVYPGKSADEMPVIGLDIELIVTEPQPYIVPPRAKPVFVKRYINTLAVDCANERLLVVVSRGFDVSGNLLFSVQMKDFVENKHQETTPVAEIMDNLVCPPLYKKFGPPGQKRNEEPEEPAPVTKEPSMTA